MVFKNVLFLQSEIFGIPKLEKKFAINCICNYKLLLQTNYCMKCGILRPVNHAFMPKRL